MDIRSRIILSLVPLAVFLGCGGLHAEALSNDAKLDVIFNYAEACRWQRPSDCSRSDPNFGDYAAVAPYRELCQDSRPSACLQLNQLLTEEHPERNPLPLSTFIALESLVTTAKNVFGVKIGGIVALQAEDAALRHAPQFPWEHDRRLFRTYYAIDDNHAFVFWPWQLGAYAGFCGWNQAPDDCLPAYAPLRPSDANETINLIFDYAESCRWQNPSNCSRSDPNFSDNPAVSPYRALCQDRRPSSCLLSNGWPAENPNRSPFTLSGFTALESLATTVKNVFGVKSGGIAALQAEDGATRRAPQFLWEHDRRLFRTYYAIDDNHAFVFWPWQLAEFGGFCGWNLAPEDCLQIYAPVRPRSNTVTLLVSLPLILPPVEAAVPAGAGPPTEPAGESGGNPEPPPAAETPTDVGTGPIGSRPRSGEERTASAQAAAPNAAAAPSAAQPSGESRGGGACSLGRDHSSPDAAGRLGPWGGLVLMVGGIVAISKKRTATRRRS